MHALIICAWSMNEWMNGIICNNACQMLSLSVTDSLSDSVSVSDSVTRVSRALVNSQSLSQTVSLESVEISLTVDHLVSVTVSTWLRRYRVNSPYACGAQSWVTVPARATPPAEYPRRARFAPPRSRAMSRPVGRRSPCRPRFEQHTCRCGCPTHW